MLFRPLAATLIVGSWNTAMGGEVGALMQSQTRNEDSLEFVNNKERVQLSELHKRLSSHQQQHKQEVEQKVHRRHQVHHLTKHHDSVTGQSVETGHLSSMKQTAREMEHQYRTILEMMVQQPKFGEEYQPPTGMISEVESVFDVIESQLEQEKETSQQAFDGANAAIKACDDDKNDGYTRPRGINDRKATSDANRVAHKDCRDEEDKMICATKAECTKFNDHQKKSCDHEQNWYVKLKDSAAPDSNSLKQLITQAQTCRTKLAAEHSQAAMCDSKQSDFEMSFCFYADRLQKVSDAYDQCWSIKDAFRTHEKARIETLEKDGKLIWKMVKKIRCYIESIKSVEYRNEPPLQGDINACTELDPETTPLDITYHAQEPYDACDLSTIQSWPGKDDKQFHQDEYAQFAHDCKKGASDEEVPDWQKALHPEKLTNVQVCKLMNSWHRDNEGGGLIQTGSSSSV